MDEIIGRCLGQYKITSKLGEGGLDVVYRGEDQKLERPVAIKIIKPSDERSVEWIERFNNECKAFARLGSDSRFVQVYHTDELADGRPYIVMEYVDGKPLSSYIGEATPPNLEEMNWRLGKFREILEAVKYAHEKGVVHRNLKPNSIMISSTGSVKIISFCVALLDGDHQHYPVCYTPYYAPPEQMNGEETDNRTDIYSLGVILYELLTGVLAEDYLNAVSVGQLLSDSVEKIHERFKRTIPDALFEVIKHCLKRKPYDRFQSVQDLLTAFNDACKGEQNS